MNDEDLKKMFENDPKTMSEAVIVAEMLSRDPNECEKQIRDTVIALQEQGNHLASMCLAYGGGLMIAKTKAVVLEMAEQSLNGIGDPNEL